MQRYFLRALLFCFACLLSSISPAAETLPSEVILKREAALSLILNGKPMGTIKAPAGSTVTLLQKDPNGLKVRLGTAEGVVAEADTNLAELQAATSPTATITAPAPPPPVIPAPEIKPVQENPTPPSSQALRIDFSAKARAGAYEAADFRLWLPDPAQPVRALLVLVPGVDGDGRGMADNGDWQKFAARNHLAIVACFFKGGNYQSPSAGSGEALEEAIAHLATESRQPKITALPQLMWGHSAGGQYDYNYVQWKPERVLAFVVNKGAYYTADRDRKSNDVPGLFFLGLKDTEVRIRNIRGIFEEGRKKNAPWALIEEPEEGHGVGKSEGFARTFFDLILPARLPENSDRLQKIDLAPGWLGNNQDHSIAPASTSAWKPIDTSWFPSEGCAQDWEKIVKP